MSVITSKVKACLCPCSRRHSLTCHQYYLQLRRDLLEERLHCEEEAALLLASLALQAEYGDYQPEVGVVVLVDLFLSSISFIVFCFVVGNPSQSILDKRSHQVSSAAFVSFLLSFAKSWLMS